MRFLSDNSDKKLIAIPIFEFAYIVDNQYPGFACYKIKPVIGKNGDDEMNFLLNSNITLKQKKYGSNEYSQNAVEILFSHNDDLIIDSIQQVITFGEDKNVVYCQRIPPEQYKSETKNDNRFYHIDACRLTLDSIVQLKQTQFRESKIPASVTYKFFAKQKLLDNPATELGYVFVLPERALSAADIIFETELKVKAMNLFLQLLPWIIIAIVSLLIIAIIRGRKATLKYSINGFTDKFKEIKNCSINEVHYFSWTPQTIEANFSMSVEPEYQYNRFLIKWKFKTVVQVEIEGLQASQLSAQIRDTSGARSQDFNAECSKFSVGKSNQFCIRLSEPAGVHFDPSKKHVFIVKTVSEMNYSLWGIFKGNCKIPTPYRYKFEIGEDLGKLWVGFDPGTTGSSIAFGNDPQNVYLNKFLDKGVFSQEITPSIVLFKQECNLKGAPITWIPNNNNYYFYGNGAYQNVNLPNVTRFGSMKKLLGHNVKCEIASKNGKITVEGTDIYALLIKGLYGDFRNYVDNGDLTKQEKQDLMGGCGFNPKRAVVAVPNNFTLKKIQDMVDSVGKLNQFKEVLFTYEAEAVLYYYIKKQIIVNSGKVMVFDMGGATINTSFFNVDFDNSNNDGVLYHIDTLGRIGYGIGGDTIDYCLINTILNLPSVKKELEIDSEDKLREYRKANKSKLLKLAFDLKLAIIESSMNHKSDVLISVAVLRSMCKEAGIYIDLDENSGEYVGIFTKDSNNNIFRTSNLTEILYDSVIDSIKELTAFEDVKKYSNQPITLIFSGRSVAFPYIKEKVCQTLKGLGFNNIKLFENANSLDKLKTIVAEGACWYGLMRNVIERTNDKCFYSFVVRKSEGAEAAFDTLIEREAKFDTNNEIKRAIKVNSKFDSDANLARIYQITGNNALEVYNKPNKKHKIRLVTKINAPSEMSEINTVLKTDDSITCTPLFSTGQRGRPQQGFVEATDIVDENGEHYLFAAID